MRARPGAQSKWKELDRYVTATSAVYCSIAKVTGARVVVDSSRLPIEPVALGLVPGVDVYAYMTHLPVQRWGRAWLERGAAECRLLRPVYDGDTAIVTAAELGVGVLGHPL